MAARKNPAKRQRARAASEPFNAQSELWPWPKPEGEIEVGLTLDDAGLAKPKKKTLSWSQLKAKFGRRPPSVVSDEEDGE